MEHECTSHVPCEHPALIAFYLGTLRDREAIIYVKQWPVRNFSPTLKSLLRALCLLTSKPIPVPPPIILQCQGPQMAGAMGTLRWQAPRGAFVYRE